jgi:hypothetical protein
MALSIQNTGQLNFSKIGSSKGPMYSYEPARAPEGKEDLHFRGSPNFDRDW